MTRDSSGWSITSAATRASCRQPAYPTARAPRSIREDAGLIDYLLRNEHTSPLEQVVLTFHIKMPIFVARQWIRHRTARINEISGRYSVMRDEFWLPAPGDIARQSVDNKQGREATPVDRAEADRVIGKLREGQKQAYSEYTELIETGIARELSRVNLPLSMYTEWYWQMDLHNLFRFLSLRLDAHAQKEIRDYAAVILDLAQKVAPMACSSFREHILGGRRVSASELEAIRRMLAGQESGLAGKDLERFKEKLGI